MIVITILASLHLVSAEVVSAEAAATAPVTPTTSSAATSSESPRPLLIREFSNAKMELQASRSSGDCPLGNFSVNESPDGDFIIMGYDRNINGIYFGNSFNHATGSGQQKRRTTLRPQARHKFLPRRY